METLAYIHYSNSSESSQSSKFTGSSPLPAHWVGGARATLKIIAPQKNFRVKPKQAGKKEGGWGEGIFARLLLSGGMAEGGFGGNSAMPERIQKEAAPAARSVRSGSQSKSFLFLLEEKNRRAQIKKCKENFLAGWRALASGGGAASLVGVLLKESSNINQKRPPDCTFCEIVRGCLGASRLGMVFFRYNPSIFEGKRKRPLGNAEVRRAKHGQNEILQTNLFSFAFGERLSVFFDCPKTNFNTIWTT